MERLVEPMALVYIVDDEPHIRRLAAIGLKDAGFETAEFSDGSVLLHAVQQKQPDAVLLDWMMPGQDGLAVLRAMRENSVTRPIPIIMMTARADEVDRVLGLELGADDYVTKPFSVKELAAYIDQSVLKPEFTQEDIRRYIQEGVDYGCATVCVNPASLDIAAELTRGTDTKICVVCDFPFGLSTTASKVLQAEEYCRRGDIFELDVVANYGWIRSGMWDEVEADIKAVCDVCHKYGSNVKVIFEVDSLTIEQVKKATETAIAAGADFVKTSTGFSKGGATREDVELMRRECPPTVKVKAAGGISSLQDAEDFINLGADRLGTSRIVKLAMELEKAEGAPNEDY